MNKRIAKTVLSSLFAFALTLPLAAGAAAQIEKYVAGTHYIELKAPVNTPDDSKIEVLEAFWYGCSHCFRFEPLVADWEAKAADDVDFRRYPAMWNALMKIHAQIYFTAEAMDAIELVHEPVFDAINVEGNRLQNEKLIGDLFEEHGIARADFEAADRKSVV